MKKGYILFALLTFNFIIAQQRAFTPKSGVIVFEKTRTIDNKSTIYNDVKLAKEQLIKEMEANGEPIDTLAINTMAEELAEVLNDSMKEVQKFHHVFKNGMIISYNTMNTIVYGDIRLSVPKPA